jgi:hypothetical protein
MSMREAGARYKYGLSRLRIRALNDDKTTPTKSNMIGGAGPFDFSAAAIPGAVTFSLKRDDSAIKTGTIVLTGTGLVITAITAAQWVTAMTAGLTAAGATGYTPSVDSSTGRVKLVSATGTYIQFWGEAATMAMFGQGRGLKAICSDTAQSLDNTAVVKADTTQTTTDANMKDTEVIIEGYKKGLTSTLVDTAEDFEMMALIESGTLDATGLVYTDPDTGTKKVMFDIESWNPLYGSGTNMEDQIVGWEKMHLRALKGSISADSQKAGFQNVSYALTGVNYKDSAGVESGAKVITRMAVTDWSPEAFDAQVAVEA